MARLRKRVPPSSWPLHESTWCGIHRGGNIHAVRDLPVAVLGVENLHLVGSVISDTLLQPDPLSYTKLLSSHVTPMSGLFHFANDGGWGPLIVYLPHQTSCGQAVPLRLCEGHAPIPSEAARKIEILVGMSNIVTRNKERIVGNDL